MSLPCIFDMNSTSHKVSHTLSLVVDTEAYLPVIEVSQVTDRSLPYVPSGTL